MRPPVRASSLAHVEHIGVAVGVACDDLVEARMPQHRHHARAVNVHVAHLLERARREEMELSKKGGLHAAISGMRGAISGMRGAISGMRGAISEMRGAISEMRGAVSGMRAGLKGVRASISGGHFQMRGPLSQPNAALHCARTHVCMRARTRADGRGGRISARALPARCPAPF
eukprot:5363509-Prymnesium_polylepis.1